jgi:hemoglobin/transferrin/lactoferrin receptor protein
MRPTRKSPRPNAFARTPLSLLLGALLACPSLVLAVDTPAGDGDVESESGHDAHTLDRVVVVATRSERALRDVPNTVDVIERADMDAHLVRDLRDLFRYEPGITVATRYGRFGVGDVRIRGLGGNRVSILADGVPVGDSFSIGSFSSANRDLVDPELLQRVEVLRGPGSALYGSDALGGVIAFRTKNPEDYLPDGARSRLGLRAGYDGDGDARHVAATWAGSGGRWSWLVNAGRRDGRETDGGGDRDIDGALRTAPDPQSMRGGSALAKLAFAPTQTQRLRLTVEGNRDRVDTDARSALGFSAATRATVTAMRGEDRRERGKVALEHEIDAIDGRFADGARWTIHRQDSRTTQDTREDRVTSAGVRQRRERRFEFEQQVDGADVAFDKRLSLGGAEHSLMYGVSWTRTSTGQIRDGRAIDLASGASTPAIPPDVFPVRDFPNSRTRTAALFVQDEIAFADGGFTLTPALRIDHYRLDPRNDAIFAADNPGVTPRAIERTSVAPKLGAVWRFAPAWSLFGGYARGFRAPPYNDVNIGFTNLAFGYTAIANPDLKPETSNGFEAGLRYTGDAAWFGVAAYENRYRDFIESLRSIGRNEAGLMVFQSQNVASARIRGLELKAGADLGGFSERLDGWSLRGAAAYAHGQDRTADRPLDGIDPLRGTLGLSYDAERWGVELAGTFAARQRRASNPDAYRPAGYGAFDLYAHWTPIAGIRVNVAVFNLGDRRYTDWADAAGVTEDSLVLDRYTRAGRSLAVSLSADW